MLTYTNGIFVWTRGRTIKNLANGLYSVHRSEGSTHPTAEAAPLLRQAQYGVSRGEFTVRKVKTISSRSFS